MLGLLLEVLLELAQLELDLINLVHGQSPAKLTLSCVTIRLLQLLVHLSEDLRVLLLHQTHLIGDAATFLRLEPVGESELVGCYGSH